MILIRLIELSPHFDWSIFPVGGFTLSVPYKKIHFALGNNFSSREKSYQRQDIGLAEKNSPYKLKIGTGSNNDGVGYDDI